MVAASRIKALLSVRLQTVFISLLGGIGCAFLLASFFDFELDNFTQRMIGPATYKGYPIGERVRLYYFILAASIIGFLAVSVLVNLLQRREDRGLWRGLNVLSFIGVILLICGILQSPSYRAMELIAALIGVWLVIVVARRLTVKPGLQGITSAVLVWIVCVGLALYFLIVEVGLMFNPSTYIPFTSFLVVFVLGAVVCLSLVRPRTHAGYGLIAARFRHLMWIPLLTLIRTEVALIFNHRGINGLSQDVIYFLGLGVIAFLVFRRWKSVPSLRTPASLLHSFYFPFAVLALGVLAFYRPVVEWSSEMFEQANPVLALHRWFEFGEVPFFETFNAHALSEFFWGLIYTFFNGYHGLEFQVYDFFNALVGLLLSYWFAFKMSRSGMFSLALVIFYPFAQFLFVPYFVYALFCVFVLFRLVKKPGRKNHYLFFATIVLAILWRIDIGFAAVFAMGIGYLVLIPKVLSRPNLLRLLKPLAISLAALLVLAVLGQLLTGADLSGNLQKVLQYLSSAQSYGHVELAYQKDVHFYAHYFLFPFLVMLFLLFLLYNRTMFLRDIRFRFAYVGFIFLILFYFFNFQRGLVRHSFIEYSDSYLSSFIFLILGLSPLLLLYKQSKVARMTITVVTSIFLVFALRHPSSAGQTSLFDKFIQGVDKFPDISIRENLVSRMTTDTGGMGAEYSALLAFFDQNLKKGQTFYDFTNAPMLYYYANRKVPSYFNQGLQNLHNDFLQKKNLEYIAALDIPFLLYRNVEESYWDGPDNVPNAIRHYRIAEYLFQNYHPFCILDGKCIWIENDVSMSGALEVPDTISSLPINRNLELLPYHWAKYEDVSAKVQQQDWKIASGDELILQLPPKLDKSTGNYIAIAVKNENMVAGKGTLEMYADTERLGSFDFSIPGQVAQENFLVRVSTAYLWYAGNCNAIRITTSRAAIEVTDVSVVKGD